MIRRSRVLLPIHPKEGCFRTAIRETGSPGGHGLEQPRSSRFRDHQVSRSPGGSVSLPSPRCVVNLNCNHAGSIHRTRFFRLTHAISTHHAPRITNHQPRITNYMTLHGNHAKDSYHLLDNSQTEGYSVVRTILVSRVMGLGHTEEIHEELARKEPSGSRLVRR
jgi:hypothetical protein